MDARWTRGLGRVLEPQVDRSSVVLRASLDLVEHNEVEVVDAPHADQPQEAVALQDAAPGPAATAKGVRTRPVQAPGGIW